jgi:hypothetical protein
VGDMKLITQLVVAIVLAATILLLGTWSGVIKIGAIAISN